MNNYFEILELEPKFNISFEQLETNYIKLQSKYHPDKSNSDAEKSMLINQAYRKLISYSDRAEHLLELNNIYINEAKLTHIKPNSQLLNMIFDLREEVATADIIEELDELDDLVEQNIKLQITDFSSKYNSDAHMAVQPAIALKYLEKLKKEIAEKKLQLLEE